MQRMYKKMFFSGLALCKLSLACFCGSAVPNLFLLLRFLFCTSITKMRRLFVPVLWKKLTSCRSCIQHNGNCPLNYVVICREFPWDVRFQQNSLAYWIEQANIIPHYAARNLLDSTGILVFGSQTIGLYVRNVWVRQVGLDFYHQTNAWHRAPHTLFST